MKKILFTILIAFFMNEIFAQQIIPLYDGEIPGSKPYTTKEFLEPQSNGDTIVHYISEPTLTIFLPDAAKANGTAVIICPGGGYWVSSIVKEGNDVARKFNEWGVAAFVLKYRIPNDSAMKDKSVAPLQDAQRAIQLVRMNAAKYHINENKIGIMGFSAGGHLAATAATHFTKNYIDNPEKISLRPDFALLIYPVISFQDSIAHVGSREQLIGKNASMEMVNLFSNELQVTAETPPTFLVQATNDDVVPVMNSIVYYEALIKNKVSAEMHLYKGGGHGFGMHNATTKDEWMERCKNWMESMGWMGKVK